MAWGLKWGSHVKAFEAQAKKTGVMPVPLKSRPRLQNQDAVYYRAFTTLSQSRPSGGMGGRSAIPISEILAFCQLVGIASKEERLKYLSLIQELDQICLEHWAEESAKTKK